MPAFTPTFARAGAALLALVLLGLAAAVVRWQRFDRAVDASLPTAAHVDVYTSRPDSAALVVDVHAADDGAPWQTTVYDVLNSPALWRRMHLAQWNAVPEPLRTRGLEHLLHHYGGILTSPSAWDRMGADDWDRVPQPIRTVAYRQMTAYWAGYYGIGARYALPHGLVADTIAAIVMSESWFDHRGLSIDPDGNRDIGLAAASDFARMRLRQLRAQGRIDIAFADPEYYDPWKSTRFAAIWMSLLLQEAGGDLRLAVRAYNRGMANAGDERGDAYLQTVERRLDRFIRNRNAPPAWDAIWRMSRAMERAAWPWILGAARRRDTVSR